MDNSTFSPYTAAEIDGVVVLHIDLSDANEQPPDDAPALPKYDLYDIKRKLKERASQIYPRHFPHARLSADGSELRTANVYGDRPKGEGSCVLNLRGDHAGCIRDWATEEHGDQLDALSYATGLTGRDLYQYAADLVGSAPSKPKGNGEANGHSDKKARDIGFILQHCEPASGSAVQTYLASRHLDLPDCPDLLFHPNLTDWDAKVGRPGMVTILRRPDNGEPVGGIHRTYLADDGSGKADMPKPKMELGPCAGGVAMLAPMRE
ncbi:MAG: hypothetical protein JO204_19045, partial [Alphaproteobacteria bacterium]|nr:hypothetical protein [Alphaproteobacteria bacterium]